MHKDRSFQGVHSAARPRPLVSEQPDQVENLADSDEADKDRRAGRRAVIGCFQKAERGMAEDMRHFPQLGF